MVKIIRILRVTVLLTLLAMSLPRTLAQGGSPVFIRRYIPPQPEAPARQNIPEREPIPQGWIYAGEVVGALLGAFILFNAVRAWRASSVFERKYTFPPAEPAAVRFGGNRSGGLMGVIEPAKGQKNA
jgi:hypothetical protein